MLDADQLLALDAIEFEISNLASTTLGLTTADTIVIDADAAGYGWYVDTTPADDLEFDTVVDDALQAAADSDAAGRMDLLTAVIHEIGHYLGIEHADSGDDPGVMEETLAAGERLVLSPPTAAALTSEFESTVAADYSVPVIDGLSIAAETLDEVLLGVISGSNNREEGQLVISVLSGEISNDAATALIRSNAALTSVPVTISTAKTTGTADTGDPARHYPPGASGWPQAVPTLRGTDLSAVATNLKLEPGTYKTDKLWKF